MKEIQDTQKGILKTSTPQQTELSTTVKTTLLPSN